MRKLFIAGALMGAMATASAQQGVVSVQQDPEIAKLLDMYKSVNEKTELYRIQVYFGSYEGAQKIKDEVDVEFAGWYSKIDFISPSYRVRLGRFQTKLEAEKNLIAVRKKYPSAILLKPEKKD